MRECWLAVGRRGGKSFILALIATYLACFADYAQYLAPGECGTVMIIAADRRQARAIFRYVRGLLHGVPMLKAMIKRETEESFTLNNSTVIEIGTASYMRSVVGQNLRRIRLEKGLSQEDLALQAGIDRTYVSSLERGVYSATVTMLEKLANVLRIEPSVLLEKSGRSRKR